MKEIERFQKVVTQVQEAVAKRLVGYGEVVQMILSALFSRGHCLIEGAPGLGKTTLVKTLGQLLGLEFSRIQFTPDLMPSDITGTYIISGAAEHFRMEFQQGPLFANIVLADEINRATPKTQSALLEAMEERQVTAGRQTFELPDPFIVLATENPIEMEGTYPLPEAQLDRFMYKLTVRMPPEDQLVEVLGLREDRIVLEPVITHEDIKEFQGMLKEVVCAEAVLRQVARLVLATQPDSGIEIARRFVRYGLSPRAGKMLLEGARFFALLDGRTHCGSQDVARVLGAVAGHRIGLNYEASVEGITVRDVLKEVAREVGL